MDVLPLSLGPSFGMSGSTISLGTTQVSTTGRDTASVTGTVPCGSRLLPRRARAAGSKVGVVMRRRSLTEGPAPLDPCIRSQARARHDAAITRSDHCDAKSFGGPSVRVRWVHTIGKCVGPQMEHAALRRLSAKPMRSTTQEAKMSMMIA